MFFIQPIWKEMEVLVKEGIVDHIGVTDLDAISLAELHSWASVSISMHIT